MRVAASAPQLTATCPPPPLASLYPTGPDQIALALPPRAQVLSFAALLFGASRAVGVEIDREALLVSRLNAEENGLGERFEALLPEQEAEGETFPVVVANILAGTLTELQPLIASRVAPGGTLLLSGIWREEQAARVLAAYEDAVEFEAPRYSEDGWALLTGVRRAD